MDSVVFENVHKIFRRGSLPFWRRRIETHALRGISLTVSRGEVLGLLGPNGSGKSTTVKLISTMLLPDDGCVQVAGYDTRDQARQVRRRVGFALANERSFFPRLTVRENLEFFAALEDVPRREFAERIETTLCAVGLMEAVNKQVMKLSSGMYQRLGIARALIKRPSVLLLDEPSRSLDAAACLELWNVIRAMSADGITIVLATHNFEEATAACDRVVLLRKGELINSRKTARANWRELREFYLEMTSEQTVPALSMEVPA